MDGCPVSFKYAASESIEAQQKPCIAKCLLPYASCIIDVKVGLSARGPSGWADDNKTVRPVGYVGNDFDTMLTCGRGVGSGGTNYPLHDFFKTQDPLQGSAGSRTEDPSKLIPTREVEAFTLTINTPAIAWKGTCRLGMCHVCVEGTQRCYSGYPEGHGIPQVCQHGRWVESRLGKELVTWTDDLSIQTALLTVILVMVILLLCVRALPRRSSASDPSTKNAPPTQTVFTTAVPSAVHPDTGIAQPYGDASA